MPESVQILIAFCFLVVVFILTRYIVVWKLRRASESIVRRLEAKGAFDESAAVQLVDPKPIFLRFGMRDYDSKALEYMVAEGVVAKTAAGKYYLLVKRSPSALG
jgi:hypothetical protein